MEPKTSYFIVLFIVITIFLGVAFLGPTKLRKEIRSINPRVARKSGNLLKSMLVMLFWIVLFSVCIIILGIDK